MRKALSNPLLWLSALGLLGLKILVTKAHPGTDAFFPKFVSQIVDSNFGVGYGVAAADINRDGKPDIVAINETQAVWFENPSWKRHVMIDGATKKDNVCLAVHDIDGDGRLDVALGAGWMSTNTETGGTLQWLKQPQKLDEPHA